MNDCESPEGNYNFLVKNRHRRHEVAASDVEETSENAPPRKKPRMSEKKKWSSSEIDLIKMHLQKYLGNNSLYSSAAELASFANKYLTSEITVAQIKIKIQY